MTIELTFGMTCSGIADTFDRLDDGKINFESLDRMLAMVETRTGARYTGLVMQGENDQWVLYTGKKASAEILGETLSGLDIDEYVLPLEGANYKVVRNNNPDSDYQYLLQTQDLGTFDIRKDSTLFEKLGIPAPTQHSHVSAQRGC